MNSSQTTLPLPDDAAVLRILSHLTDEMREELPEDERKVITSADEAREVVATVLALVDEERPSGTQGLLRDDTAAAADARKLLRVLQTDESTRPRLEELLAHPPDADQRSVVAIAATAIVLGALVTWLQTKVRIKIRHKDGKTEISVDLDKKPTDKETIKSVLRTVSGFPGAR